MSAAIHFMSLFKRQFMLHAQLLHFIVMYCFPQLSATSYRCPQNWYTSKALPVLHGCCVCSLNLGQIWNVFSCSFRNLTSCLNPQSVPKTSAENAVIGQQIQIRSHSVLRVIGWRLSFSVLSSADIGGLIGCLAVSVLGTCFPSSRISQCPFCHNTIYISAMKIDYHKAAYSWAKEKRERE